jgi:hypothetical protein
MIPLLPKPKDIYARATWLATSAALALSLLTTTLLAAPVLVPEVSTAARNVTTEPLRLLQERALREEADKADLKGGDPEAFSRQKSRVIERFDRPRPAPRSGKAGVDRLRQTRPMPGQPEGFTPSMPTPTQNFEGQGNTSGVLPPDTNGDVGPDHYVQMVNLTLAVYDKSGTLLLGPVASNTFWSPIGGLCASNNDGDPVVLYDQGADRWLISQFALSDPDDYHECVAISQTGNPTGAWHLYDFLASTSEMNDYPKLGVWPDAYYMSANDFTFNGAWNWSGVSVYAFERDQMLQGRPARMIKFNFSATDNIFGFLPADWDGTTPPPANAPNPFVYLRGDEIDGNPDGLGLWLFHVDWTTPANSTFTGQTLLPVAAFDANLCDWSRNCIPQPGGTALDAISDRLMFRNQYRNLGASQALVLNHTVDATGADLAGLRWYQLTNSGGGWSLAQQGTYAPQDGHQRWMGSIAMDKDANLAIGYSISSTSLFPSIAYTGRLAGDPANTLPQGETSLILGNGSQSHTSGRWGDYSSMSVDPVDDCTFWYTQEYYAADSNSGWQTRIGAFRYPSCVSGPTGGLAGRVTAVADGTPLSGAQVQAGPLTSFTDTAGDYAFLRVPVGTYDLTASAWGYANATAPGVAVTPGSITTQNLALSTATPVQVCGRVTDGSGQGWPLYARITILGAPLAPVFTDPFTGHYCVGLYGGQSYLFEVNAESGGYLTETRSLVLSSQPESSTQDFTLRIDAGQCNAPGYSGLLTEDFDGQSFPPAGWTRLDNAGTGVVWDTSSAWGDGNYTGGSGQAATVDSDTAGEVAYDTELRTPLIGGDVSQLSYLANFIYYSTEFLDLDIITDGGSSWENILSWSQEDHGGFYDLPGELVSLDLAPYINGASHYQLRWRYFNPDSNWDYYAQIDNVSIGACQATPGSGLAVGNVYDGNDGAGLNGASVTDSQGQVALTFATPDNPALDDGLYILATAAGAQPLTATATGYGAVLATTTIGVGTVTEQNFNLPAALLTQIPAAINLTLLANSARTEMASLVNEGTLAANFVAREIDAPYLAPEITGPFAAHGRRVSPKHLHDRDARLVYDTNLPEAEPLAAGTVIATWPTALPYAWGIGYNQTLADLWLGNIEAGGAGVEVADYRYLTNGTTTGDRIDISAWIGVWAADMAYNPLSGHLWQVNVGGDNCIHELNPVSKSATGNTICPGFGTSERGLAYDPTTDTYYAGSWNDGVINHFAPDGTLLDSVYVGLDISGLAFNPRTGHLFVMNNSESPAYDVYVLDVHANYALLGGFDIAGLGDYEQAALEIDCAGSLWAVNQTTQMVIQTESGETNACVMDIPWLSVSPSVGTIGAGANRALTYPVDTTGMSEGVYEGHVRLTNDGPYGDVIVPVTLAVTPSLPSPLQNHTRVTGLSGDAGTLQYFSIQVPNGVTNLAIATSGGTGDVTLLVRRGQFPTLVTYDCRSNAAGNTETCTFPTPQGGTWYIALYAAGSFTGVTLTAGYDDGSTCAVGDDHLVLQNATVNGTETRSACRTITIGPNVGLSATANLTLQAGERIVFRPIFGVRADATFHAQINPLLKSSVGK